jgi:hypothetical protein
MNVGDWVKVVRQGLINYHIKMVDYIGKIEEINEFAAQINFGKNGAGAVEFECLKLIPEPSDKIKRELGFV